jgi:hypothetical protein
LATDVVKLLSEIAETRQVPKWWVLAVIIEHTDCRTFAGASEIWEFRFDTVNRGQIDNALNGDRVVIGDTLFHNVNRETFASRALHRAFGDIPVPPQSLARRCDS